MLILTLYKNLGHLLFWKKKSLYIGYTSVNKINPSVIPKLC